MPTVSNCTTQQTVIKNLQKQVIIHLAHGGISADRHFIIKFLGRLALDYWIIIVSQHA